MKTKINYTDYPESLVMRITNGLRGEMQEVFAAKTVRINLMACFQGFVPSWDTGILMNSVDVFDTLAELCQTDISTDHDDAQ